MQDADKWLRDRVAYIKGLKSPSAQQKRLVELAESARSAQDEKALRVLVRAEKADERASNAKRKASHLLRQEEKSKRKITDRRKYLLGAYLLSTGAEMLPTDYRWPSQSLRQGMDAFLTRDDHRKVFGLPPRPKRGEPESL